MVVIPHLHFEEFNRQDEFHTVDKPGWMETVRRDGTVCKPLIRCTCGVWTGIRLHHVHADGTVTASFYHKKGTNFSAGESPEGCEWHVHLMLQDYTFGDFPPGAD